MITLGSMDIIKMSESTPAAAPVSSDMHTPFTGVMTPEVIQRIRWEAEVDERNRYMTMKN